MICVRCCCGVMIADGVRCGYLLMQHHVEFGGLGGFCVILVSRLSRRRVMTVVCAE